jgi:hypothetical protein
MMEELFELLEKYLKGRDLGMVPEAMHVNHACYKFQHSGPCTVEEYPDWMAIKAKQEADGGVGGAFFAPPAPVAPKPGEEKKGPVGDDGGEDGGEDDEPMNDGSVGRAAMAAVEEAARRHRMSAWESVRTICASMASFTHLFQAHDSAHISMGATGHELDAHPYQLMPPLIKRSLEAMSMPDNSLWHKRLAMLIAASALKQLVACLELPELDWLEPEEEEEIVEEITKSKFDFGGGSKSMAREETRRGGKKGGPGPATVVSEAGQRTAAPGANGGGGGGRGNLQPLQAGGEAQRVPTAQSHSSAHSHAPTHVSRAHSHAHSHAPSHGHHSSYTPVTTCSYTRGQWLRIDFNGRWRTAIIDQALPDQGMHRIRIHTSMEGALLKAREQEVKRLVQVAREQKANSMAVDIRARQRAVKQADYDARVKANGGRPVTVSTDNSSEEGEEGEEGESAYEERQIQKTSNEIMRVNGWLAHHHHHHHHHH